MLQLSTRQYELLGELLEAEMGRMRADMQCAPTADREADLRLIERAQELSGLVDVFQAAATTHVIIEEVSHG